MAAAGWCRVCGANVWLNDQWGCANGHPWSEIANWYDTETGTAISPPWAQSASAAVPAPASGLAPAASVPASGSAAPAPVAEASANVVAQVPATARDRLLADIVGAFGAYAWYAVRYGTDTDVVIDNQVADMAWGTGKKKVDYEAVLKAVEAEGTVYFWEMLKERGGGVSFGGFEAESYSSFGGKRWGTTKQAVVGPGGAGGFEWDYAATRRIVEEVVARHGWQLKVVLRKKSAQW